MSKVIPINGKLYTLASSLDGEGNDTCDGCAFKEDQEGCYTAPDCPNVVYKEVKAAEYKPTHGGYPNV